MNKKLLSIVAASALVAGLGVASAQTTTTTTTTTWTNDHGMRIREHSTTQKFEPINDPALKPGVGIILPSTVMLHPLPSTITVPNADTYSYTIVNNQPVVVERTTRRVVHTWQ